MKDIKIGDKVKLKDNEGILAARDPSAIGLIVTVVDIIPDTYRGMLLYKVEHPDLMYEYRFTRRFLELINCMSDKELKKCAEYKQKNICNRYCEMLQDGKCNKENNDSEVNA